MTLLGKYRIELGKDPYLLLVFLAVSIYFFRGAHGLDWAGPGLAHFGLGLGLRFIIRAGLDYKI